MQASVALALPSSLSAPLPVRLCSVNQICTQGKAVLGEHHNLKNNVFIILKTSTQIHGQLRFPKDVPEGQKYSCWACSTARDRLNYKLWCDFAAYNARCACEFNRNDGYVWSIFLTNFADESTSGQPLKRMARPRSNSDEDMQQKRNKVFDHSFDIRSTSSSKYCAFIRYLWHSSWLFLQLLPVQLQLRLRVQNSLVWRTKVLLATWIA